MRPEPLASSQARPLLGAEDIQPLLWRLSRELQERHPQGGVVLCGIVTRGVFLAARLLALVQQGPAAGWAGARLDCGPYRDDGARPPDPATFPLPQAGPAEVEGRPVVLVDDVLFHGRTARAALAALAALGRPRAVELLVLVDRGHRELPLRATYVGRNLPTASHQRVGVLLRECDGEDAVVLQDGEANWA